MQNNSVKRKRWLEDTVDRIQENNSVSSFDFLNITDVHLTPQNEFNQKEAIEQFIQMGSLLNVNFLSVTGDLINGNASFGSTKEEAASSLSYVANYMMKHCPLPLYVAKGNHDDNLWNGEYDQNMYGILPKDWYKLIVDPFTDKRHFPVDDVYGNYFYADYPDAKIRVITLNSVDVPYAIKDNGLPSYWGMWRYAFQQAQINWLAHDALQVEAGWGVIVLAHNPITKEMAVPGDRLPDNGHVVHGLLQAFDKNERWKADEKDAEIPCEVQVDFTDNKGEFICYINGHVHFDKVKKVDGITYINQLSSRATQDGKEHEIITPERIIGTPCEESFTLYQVDRKHKEIHLIRHGAGEDQKIYY